MHGVLATRLSLAAALGMAAVALPSSAFADSVKRYDRDGVPAGVVKRAGLTADERRTLDISYMRVTGAEGFGVMVDVRLHGDVQRRLGQGGLRRAALAVTLHSTAGPASSVTVLTRGEAVRDQRVLRSPAGTAVAAVRTGRTVRVFVHTPGFAAIERVEAVSFARGPVAPDDLRDAVEADRMELQLDPRETMPELASCDELEHMYDGITRAIGGADKLLFRLERLELGVRVELGRTRSAAKRRALKRVLGELRTTHGAARAQLGLLLTVGGEGELLLGDC